MSPPEQLPSSKYSNVELVPWDPDSDAHGQRLYDQRVACSWDEDLIDEWRAKVREGKKFLYWIVRFESLSLLHCFLFNLLFHWLITVRDCRNSAMILPERMT